MVKQLVEQSNQEITEKTENQDDQEPESYEAMQIAIEYTDEATDKTKKLFSKKSKGKKFDLIIMDINYTEEDKNISPPWKFLETEFLQKICDMGSENCLIAFNILYYSADAKKKVFDNILALKNIDK